VKTPSDRLTLLVFKDNRSPRTFQISLRWLSRVGFLTVGLALITLIAVLFALRFYYRSQRMNSGAPDFNHVKELEDEISALKSQKPQLAPGSGPIPTVTVTAMPRTGNGMLFSALPSTVTPLSPGENPSIAMQNLRSRWQGKKLLVSFDLQYSGPEGGNQSGHIVIIARGPSTLFTYPSGVLNPSDQGSLINPEHGEYFSVSHFRQTNAEFAAPDRTSLQDLQILIFGSEGKLLLDQKVKAGETAPQPETTPSAAPSP